MLTIFADYGENLFKKPFLALSQHACAVKLEILSSRYGLPY